VVSGVALIIGEDMTFLTSMVDFLAFCLPWRAQVAPVDPKLDH